MSFDYKAFLEPVSEDSPCGENLEDNPAFDALRRVAAGKSARGDDDTYKPAVDPVWKEVFADASALLAKSKDLRIAIHLTHAALNLHGLRGLVDGLNLIDGLLERYWDQAYPALDAENDNDPTIRLNWLLGLEDRPMAGEPDRPAFLRSVSRIPIVSDPRAGEYTLRDYRLANGDVSPLPDEKDSLPDIAVVRSAFTECDVASLKESADAAHEALEVLQRMVRRLEESSGAGAAPDFGDLRRELLAMHGIFREFLEIRGESVPGEESGEQEHNEPGAGGRGTSIGEIQTRDDAIRALDRISDYFRRNEPSSPVPLLLDRAKRLVAKDFMEILADLTPKGVDEVRIIGGLDKED